MRNHCLDSSVNPDPQSEFLVVSRLTDADMEALTGVREPEGEDKTARESQQSAVVCFAALLNTSFAADTLQPPASHGHHPVVLQDIGVGLWPVGSEYAGFQRAFGVAEAAIDLAFEAASVRDGKLRREHPMQGLPSLMGLHSGATSAGSASWHHCSGDSHGCRETHESAHPIASDQSAPGSWLAGVSRTLLKVQLGHVSTRLEWCHRVARDLSDITQRIQAAYNPWIERLGASGRVLITASPISEQAAASLTTKPKALLLTVLEASAAALTRRSSDEPAPVLPDAEVMPHLVRQHQVIVAALNTVRSCSAHAASPPAAACTSVWSVPCARLAAKQAEKHGSLGDWITCLAELGVIVAASPQDSPVNPANHSRFLESAHTILPSKAAEDEASHVLQVLAAAAFAPADAPVLVPSAAAAARALQDNGMVAMSVSPAVVVRVNPLNQAASAAGQATHDRLKIDEATLRRVCSGLALCQMRASHALFAPATGPASAGATAPAKLSSALHSGSTLASLPNWSVHAGQMFTSNVRALAGKDPATSHAVAVTSGLSKHVFSLALGNAYFRHAASADARRFVPRPRDRHTLVIIAEEFGGGWYPDWGPWTAADARGRMGGSEEAGLQVVASMADVCRDKPALCVHVEVYKERVPAQYRGTMQGSAAWYPTSWLSSPTPPLESHQECLRRTHQVAGCSHQHPPGVIFMSWRYVASLGAVVSIEEVAESGRLSSVNKTHSGRASAAMVQTVTHGRVRAMYLWLQDVVGPVQAGLSSSLRAVTSGVFFLSHFHAQSTIERIPAGARSLIRIARNGIHASLVTTGGGLEHDPMSLVYASAPNRGLETILRAWPMVLRAFPQATLHVYYGFTQGFQKYIRTVMGELAASWLQDMQQLLKQPNVRYHGMVSAEQLASAYNGAGFLLYPTSFAETGCIAVVKAMAQGVIPITSRYPESVLPELLSSPELDWGPELPSDVARVVAPAGNLRSDPESKRHWAKLADFPKQAPFRESFAFAVIEALRVGTQPHKAAYVQAVRAKLAVAAATRLTWHETASRMLQAFHDDAS
jgi:glycosyltransferase involved in cell wall biosynthesis